LLNKAVNPFVSSILLYIRLLSLHKVFNTKLSNKTINYNKLKNKTTFKALPFSEAARRLEKQYRSGCKLFECSRQAERVLAVKEFFGYFFDRKKVTQKNSN
jgi:hypothetical protein